MADTRSAFTDLGRGPKSGCRIGSKCRPSSPKHCIGACSSTSTACPSHSRPRRRAVEIRILERLFTPEEAGIALELSAIPEPAATIHKRLKSRMALPELKQKLDQMGKKGNILAWPIEGEIHYAKLIFAIGMYERQLKTLTPEFERD